jgi:parallel beta-helix repeat protein
MSIALPQAGLVRRTPFRLRTYRAGVPAATGLVIKPENYGAQADGRTDCTQAFMDAAATMNANPNSTLQLSSGTYLSNAGLVLSQNGAIVGEGQRQTAILRTVKAATPAITVSSPDFRLAGFGIVNLVPAGVGGDGIVFNAAPLADQPMIEDVFVQQAYRGIVLGPAAYGVLRDSCVIQSVSDGVLFQGNSTYNVMQWMLDGVLSECNGGDGFKAIAASTTNPANAYGAMGIWRAPYAFGNKGNGISIVGPGSDGFFCSLQIVDGCFSTNAGHHIHIDSHGWYFIIIGNDMEGAGYNVDGSTAPGVYSGIHLSSAGNLFPTIGNNNIQGTTGSGIFIESPGYCVVSGNVIYSAGRYGYELGSNSAEVHLTGNASWSDKMGKLSGKPASKVGGNL